MSVCSLLPRKKGKEKDLKEFDLQEMTQDSGTGDRDQTPETRGVNHKSRAELDADVSGVSGRRRRGLWVVLRSGCPIASSRLRPRLGLSLK
jgi:hypothetical protein